MIFTFSSCYKLDNNSRKMFILLTNQDITIIYKLSFAKNWDKNDNILAKIRVQHRENCKEVCRDNLQSEAGIHFPKNLWCMSLQTHSYLEFLSTHMLPSRNCAQAFVGSPLAHGLKSELAAKSPQLVKGQVHTKYSQSPNRPETRIENWWLTVDLMMKL